MNRREMLQTSGMMLSGSLFRSNRRPRSLRIASAHTKELQEQLNAARPDSTLSLLVAGRSCEIDRALRVDVPGITIDGVGLEIRQLSLGEGGLVISAPNVTVKNLTLTGPTDKDPQASSVGVSWRGRAQAYLKNEALTDSILRGWTKGVEGKYCDHALVTRCSITDVDYAGVIFESSRNSEVSGNTIGRVLGSPNAYGVAITRAEGRLADHPPSTGFNIFGNTISEIPYWEALDTHGGAAIHFYRNLIINARIGIMMTTSEGMGPARCSAFNNTIRAGTASPQTGVEIVGVSGALAEDCKIENNVIEGYGTQGSDAGAAVRVQWAVRPKIAANTITDSKQSAIAVFGTVRDLDIRSNFVSKIDASAGPFIAAIKIPSGNVTGQIVDNRIEAGIAAGIRTYAPQPVLVERNEIVTTGRKYHPDISSFRSR